MNRAKYCQLYYLTSFQNVSEGFSAMVAQNIQAALLGLVSIYLPCYFSDVINEQLQAIAEVIYSDSDWLEHPPELRRHLLMIMRTSQQPVFFSAFGLRVLTCSMENFTTVSD